MWYYKWFIFYTLSLVLLPSTVIFSAELHYRFGIGITNYDNINLLPEPIDNEVARMIEGDLDITENTAHLTANLRSSISVVDYKNNQAEDETVGRFLTDVLYRIKPNRLEWYISEIFTQISIDQLSADSISNRQNTNAFTTGPNYLIRINPRSNVNISARAEDYKYEVEEIDNSRLNTNFGLNHTVNSSLNYTFSYIFEIVNFDENSINSDFNRNDLFFRTEYEFGSNALELEYGFTKIDFDIISNIHEYRYLIGLESERTSSSSLSFNVSHSLEDTSSDLLTLLEISETSTGFVDIVPSSSDIYIDDEVNLSFTRFFTSGNLLLGATLSKQRYNQQIILDIDQENIFTRYTLDLRDNSSAILEIFLSSTEYKNISPLRIDDDKLYRLRYTDNLSRHMNLDYVIASEERNSTITNNNFSDLRFSIILSYSSR